MVTAVRGSSSLEIAPISTASNAQKEVVRRVGKRIFSYLDPKSIANLSYANGDIFKLVMPEVLSDINRIIEAFIEDVKRGLED
jgi:hypothetical protein